MFNITATNQKQFPNTGAIECPHQKKGGGEKMNENYVLIAAELLLAAAASFLPAAIERCLKIKLHRRVKAAFFAFVLCAIFLGEVFDFYYRVPHWDDMLHCASGAMTAYLGFTLLGTLGKRALGDVRLPLGLIAAAVFCFSLTIGGIWELYEFAMDGLFGTNMQKAVTQSGELLSGHAAAADTMKDLAVDCLGAAISCAWCALNARRKAASAPGARYEKTNDSKAA
jgi:hypothetical protein